MTFVTSALGEVPELGIRRKTAPCTPPELFYKDEAVEHKYCVLDAEGLRTQCRLHKLDISRTHLIARDADDAEGLQKSKKQNVPFFSGHGCNRLFNVSSAERNKPDSYSCKLDTHDCARKGAGCRKSIEKCLMGQNKIFHFSDPTVLTMFRISFPTASGTLLLASQMIRRRFIVISLPLFFSPLYFS